MQQNCPAPPTVAGAGDRAVWRWIALVAACCLVATPARGERIVVVGGTLTEIVFALGGGDDVVGVDSSSVYPETAAALPQVGYQRTLSAEGVLSLSPTLILLTQDAGPPPAIAQIRSAGARVVVIEAIPTVDGARAAIRAVASLLGREQRGEEMVRTLDADLARAGASLAGATSRPKVLFLYARGGGLAMVSGSATAADEMIRLAGGVNAVTDYEGFKPLTPEAGVSLGPEVILVPSRGLDAIGGRDALFALAGLDLTPAGKGKRVVAMDDLYLLGFGPRTGRAVLDLAVALHPELR
jgi:iron complex transport system substrate-binding protein